MATREILFPDIPRSHKDRPEETTEKPLVLRSQGVPVRPEPERLVSLPPTSLDYRDTRDPGTFVRTKKSHDGVTTSHVQDQT